MRLPQVSEGVRKLKPTESAYLAGLIDGEGWIGLMLKKEKTRRRVRFQPVIHICNTNLTVLEWARDTIEYGSVGKHAHEYSKKNKLTYRYTLLRNDEIIKLLTQIKKYLIIKKEHVNVLLKYCRRKKKKHVTAADFTNYRKLRLLNKRGKKTLKDFEDEIVTGIGLPKIFKDAGEKVNR